jgi:hypothetical protein
MKEFHFGDDPRGYDAQIVVTDYECGSWEGSGSALTLENDGTVRLHNLGHCSCYGPWENSFDEWANLDALIEDSKSVLCTVSQEMLDKLLELAGRN